MTFREQCVIRVLLLVARICADDEALSGEIKKLGTHIEYGERHHVGRPVALAAEPQEGAGR